MHRANGVAAGPCGGHAIESHPGLTGPAGPCLLPASPAESCRLTPPAAAVQSTSVPAAQPAPTAAPSAQAAPTTAPAAVQPGPRGKYIEAWNTSLSPAWNDPQENPPQITPYNFQLAMHDALVKHMPGKTFAPSLAESYEVAPNFKSATFKLRQGIKFHDGSPITPDDVIFTYEKYRGANAKILHDKLEKVDVPDSRTVKLLFKEPFVDFMMIYGSPSSGAGWIVPTDWPGALDLPVPPTDIAQAKRLMAEAGVGDGFDISLLTPLPPYFTWGERLVSQLRTVGIKTNLNTMERAAFYDQMNPGPNRLKGLVLMFSGAPGDDASRIRESAVTGGTFSGLSVPEIDAWMKQYDSSTDVQERKRLVELVQKFTLEQYLMVPVCRNVAIWGFGPRLANNPLETVVGSVPQYNYLGLYEDLQIKD